MKQPIELQTNIKIAFDELNVTMRNILDNKKEELALMIKNTVENFDFEKILTEKIHSKINYELDKVVEDIDILNILKPEVKRTIGKIFENNL